MTLTSLTATALASAALLAAPMAHADNKVIANDEMEAYLEFVNARDAGQFAKGHIPGSVNMDWRHVLAKRNTIHKK